MDGKKERFGIYGGSFSPIHMGHVRAAYAFLDSVNLDSLLIMPSGQSPHKPKDPYATGEDRLNMCHLAFNDGEPYKKGILEVSDFEILREGKSYTVLTLEHFASPERELFFLVGTDMFFTLSKWFRAEEIFKLATIVLMRREDDTQNTPLIKAARSEYESRFGARIYEIDEPPTVVSSTELRERLELSLDCVEMLHPAVDAYIKEKGLYKRID